MEKELDKSGFVVLSQHIPDIIEEVRYYTNYNFIGERIRGYETNTIIITKEAMEALKKVNEEAKKKGYLLKVYDAYRPQMAVDHFVSWAEDISDTKMKEYFYPNVNKEELFEKGFIARKSGHSRGSTIDLTLFDMKTGKEVDMGGVFDYFGEQSFVERIENLTENQIANRKTLRELMTKNGFKGIKSEWWHFTLIDEPYPNTYFNFPVNIKSF